MRIYFSHAIRGQVGPSAGIDTQNNNCDAAKEMARKVEKFIASCGDRIPLSFYIPAEHEDFVQIAYRDKIICEEKILEVDCKIITERCDACIVYVPYWDILQGGRETEWKHCIDTDVPVCIFSRATEAAAFIEELHNDPDFKPRGA
jgi:hypothetical protein